MQSKSHFVSIAERLIENIEGKTKTEALNIVTNAIESTVAEFSGDPIDEFDALRTIFELVKMLGPAEKRYLVSRLISEDTDGQKQPVEN